MLKQKFIPMMSTALLLFSCAGPRAIDIDKPLKLRSGKPSTNDDEIIPSLKTEKINTEK